MAATKFSYQWHLKREPSVLAFLSKCRGRNVPKSARRAWHERAALQLAGKSFWDVVSGGAQ